MPVGALAVLGVLNLVCAMDAAMIYTTMTPIAAEFNEGHVATDIVTMYLLACAASQPAVARVSGALGRWCVVNLAQWLLGLGLALCCVASSAGLLCLGRVLVGAGAGIVYTVSALLVYDMFPLRDRPVYLGYQNIVCSIGSMIGGPVAGILVNYVSWRASFALILALLAACVAVSTQCDTELVPKDKIDWANLRGVDFGGILSLNVFIVSTYYLLSQLKDPSGLNRLSVLSMLVSIASGAAFIAIEKSTPDPLIQEDLVRGEIGMLGVIATVNSLGLNIVLFFTPLYLEIVQNISIAKVGIFTTFCVVSISMGSMCVGFVMKKLQHNDSHTMRIGILMVLGSLIVLTVGVVALFTIIAATASHSAQYIGWKVWLAASLVVAGIGGGAFHVAIAVYATGLVEENEKGNAHTVLMLVKSLGGTFGLSVSCALYNNSLTKYLKQTLPMDLSEGLIENYSSNIKRLPSEYLNQVLAVYKQCFQISILPFIIFSAITIVFILTVLPQILRNHKNITLS